MKISGEEKMPLKFVHSEDIDATDNSGVVRFREIQKQLSWQKRLKPIIPKIIELESDDWAELFLFANDNLMIKTPLQKSLFLFSMRSGLPEEIFCWKPDNYGPYSRETEDKIKASEEIQIERQLNNKHSGITYKYKLRDSGKIKKIWEALPSEVRELIREVSGEIKKLRDVQNIEKFVHDAYPKYAVNAVC